MNQGMTAETHTQNATKGLAASVVFVAMLVAALSLWTVVPVAWLYIGSKVSHTQFPSGGPYFVVAVGIVVTVAVVGWLIAQLNGLYMRITGTNRVSSMRPTWLKSMRDTGGASGQTTVVEAVLMGSVMLAGCVFAVWFFLLAGSPLPSQ